MKLHALARVIPYMDLSKKLILMNAFFDSQFNYCPLIWMCHSRKRYHKINRLHEKCLRIIYNDRTSSYEELLSKDDSVFMHHKNLQKFVIEIYKVANGLYPGIMNEVFQFPIQSHSNLRNNTNFRTPSFNTIFKGKDNVCCWIYMIIPLILNMICFGKFRSIFNIFVIFILYFLFNLYFTSVDFGLAFC